MPGKLITKSAFAHFQLVLSLFGAALALALPAHAQSFPTGDSIAVSRGQGSNILLDGVTVRSKQLSTADIIDSVIAHSKSNYLLPSAFHVKLDISLHDATDTFFSSTTDAYLIKPLEKMKRYLLIVPSDSAYRVRVNRLSKQQSSRILDVETFPQETLSDYLSDWKTQIADNESAYAYNTTGTDSQFSILIRYVHRSHSLFARKNLDSPSSKTISFAILKVNVSDWALASSYRSEMEVSGPEHAHFFQCGNYGQLSNFIARQRRKPHAKHLSFEIAFFKAAGKYCIQHATVENDLYLLRSFSSRRNKAPESGIYRYSMYDFQKSADTVHQYSLFNVKKLISRAE